MEECKYLNAVELVESIEKNHPSVYKSNSVIRSINSLSETFKDRMYLSDILTDINKLLEKSPNPINNHNGNEEHNVEDDTFTIRTNNNVSSSSSSSSLNPSKNISIPHSEPVSASVLRLGDMHDEEDPFLDMMDETYSRTNRSTTVGPNSRTIGIVTRNNDVI